MRELRRNERPRVEKKPHRNLDSSDLWRLVDAADKEWRAFVALLAWAGLRQSEAIGLAWADIDLDERVIHVRWQLDRVSRSPVEPKTSAARRTVDIGDDLVAILREWKLRSRFSRAGDFVVVTVVGTPLDHRAAARRLDAVVNAAGLAFEGLPRITAHQLRYTYGSLLLDPPAGEPLPVGRVSALMGHGSTAVTQEVYAHVIEHREARERTRSVLGSAFGRGTNVERTGGNGREPAATGSGTNVAALPVSGTGGHR